MIKMTKLKTLKDMELELESCSSFIEVGHWNKHIKQEAIKWVRPLVNAEHLDLGMHLWLQFFNITEEELR